MPAWAKSRWLALAVAVGYALTITTASLFHDHGSHDGVRCCHGHSLAHAASKHCTGDESDQSPGHRNAPRAPARCPGDDGRCSVCQFLGQKPIPAAEVTTVVCGTLVQEVSAPAPARGVVRVFSAWQSRAPPAA